MTLSQDYFIEFQVCWHEPFMTFENLRVILPEMTFLFFFFSSSTILIKGAWEPEEVWFAFFVSGQTFVQPCFSFYSWFLPAPLSHYTALSNRHLDLEHNPKSCILLECCACVRAQLCLTLPAPRTVASQAPLFMEL